MKRVTVSWLCLVALAMLGQVGSFGQASDPPKAGVPVKFFCPVAGVPEAKACCCPGGYCPRMPTAKHTVDYKGTKLQLCCSQCKKVFQESPAKFAAVANHQLFATKQAKQEKCPLCGGKVDLTAVSEVTGLRVSFCSQECAKKVAAASAQERMNLVFGEQAFARGFVVTLEQKK